MPHSVHSDFYDVLLGFENIIFILYFPSYDGYYISSDDIYCFDILFNKWYKSTYKIPYYIDSEWNVYALKDTNNFIHILDF